MLVQSHEGYIHVLPALPSKWKDGEFYGLSARGGFTVSAKWKDHAVTEIYVESKKDSKLKILTGRSTKLIETEIKAGERKKIDTNE